MASVSYLRTVLFDIVLYVIALVAEKLANQASLALVIQSFGMGNQRVT